MQQFDAELKAQQVNCKQTCSLPLFLIVCVSLHIQGADGVCRLLGTCEKSGKLCLIMKRYECSLADKMADGPLSAVEIRRIGHSICQSGYESVSICSC